MDINSLKKILKYNTAKKPVLLLGEAGLGKSAFVHSYAKEIGYDIIDLRLSQYEPIDFTGLPYREESGKEQIQRYARPELWPSTPFLLFLDELDTAHEQMQGPAMQLCLDKKVGSVKLHPDTIIFAAANGQRYNRTEIDAALMRRFIVVDFKPTVKEWLDWAQENKINRYVFDFIKCRPEMLDTSIGNIGVSGKQHITRASWVDFSKWLDEAIKDGLLKDKDCSGLIKLAINAYLGEDRQVGTNFIDFHFHVKDKHDCYTGIHSVLKVKNWAESIDNIDNKEEIFDKASKLSPILFEVFFNNLPKSMAENVSKHKDMSKRIEAHFC